MIYIITASILFGLVHPGSKYILGSNLSLLNFCFLYICIRFIFQLLVYVKNYKLHYNKKKPFFTLIIFGLVGLTLQISEFFGIYQGLSVSTVTFLVYSHPIWSIFLSALINKESITKIDIVRVLISILGIYLISFNAIQSGFSFDLKIIAPIFAGFMIALWSSISNKLRKQELDSFEISFYYDFFALIGLSILIFSNNQYKSDFIQISMWIKNISNLSSIIIYSIFLGLLPNILFYKGSKYISNFNASLILLIEPIIASVISVVTFKENIQFLFFFGALLVLYGALPISDILKKITLTKKSRLLILSLILLCLIPLKSFSHTIHLIEFSPAEEAEYTTNYEQELIKKTADLSLLKIKNIFPKCDLNIEKTIQKGTESELFKTLSDMRNQQQKSTLVGLSRSTFARVGAKATSSKDMIGLSIGASTVDLSKLNKNFYSIVSPFNNQINLILDDSKKYCKKLKGIFDARDYLSKEYLKLFEKNNLNYENIDFENTSKLNLDNIDCIFVGLNLSKSESILTHALKKKNLKTIYGTGDWGINLTELNKILSNMTITQKILIPTGWHKNINSLSLKYFKTLQNKYKIIANPIGAYTYDSLLIAAFTLCNKNNISNAIKNPNLKKNLLRDYTKITTSHNLLSKLFLINEKGELHE
ncbi:MAG: DMT family transporter [Pseudobdellovibrio sp.]